MQMTSSLDRNMISIRETVSESLMKIRRRHVPWRHNDVIFRLSAKIVMTSSKNGYFRCQIMIFPESMSRTYKMRGQSFFYDQQIESYRHFLILSDFDDVIIKYDVIMTSPLNWWRYSKLLRGLYNRGKFHPPSVSGTQFSQGGVCRIYPPYDFRSDITRTE